MELKKNPAPLPRFLLRVGSYFFFLTLPPADSSHQAWTKLKVLVSVKSSMSALWETVKSCRIEALFVMDLTFIRAILAAICCWIIIEDDNMLQILEHPQDLITSADGSAGPHAIANICWLIIHTGEINQLKSFRGKLQGREEVELILWSGGGSVWGDIIYRRTQRAQRRAESRGCETGLQISVWRADAVTFVVCGVPLFKSRPGTSSAFSVVASYRIPAMAAGDQTQQHQ